MRAELHHDLEAIRGEWTRLAELSGNVFSTWEWASTWWMYFGGRRPLRLVGCRGESGAMEAIVPLFESSARPLRTLRFVGHSASDRQVCISAPEAGGPALASVVDFLAQSPWSWDLILGERLPGDGALLPGRLVRREASPVIEIAGRTWDEFLATRSGNLRQQIGRRERALRRRYRVTYRTTTDPDRLDRDIETLFRLHDARWGQDASAGFSGAVRDFHRRFARIALDRGWLRLQFLELDGRPAAAWYGFRYGGAEWYYQAGRNPAFERESVGFVLLANTIREAFDAGLERYRLLRGDQHYKLRFATNDPGVQTCVVARGARAKAALAASRVLLALPPRVRRPLVRLAG